LSLADLKQKWAQLRDAQPQGAATDADADPLTWLERLPREAAMLACAGGAVLLLMLLASFHPDDPGWMSSGTDGDVRNLAGPAGAWLADVLLSVLGITAYGLPWALLWAGLRLLRVPEIDEVTGEPSLLQVLPWPVRWVSAVLLAASLSALFAQHVGVAHDLAPQGAGGIAGQAISSGLMNALGVVGSSLVLLVLALASAPLVFAFSWLRVMDRLGGMALNLAQRAEHVAARPASADMPDVPERAAPAPRKMTVRRVPKLSGDDVDVPPPEAFELVPEVDGPKPGRAAAKPASKPAKAPRGNPLADVPPFEGDPLPPIELLDAPRASGKRYTEDELDVLSRDVERHLASFGVKVEVVDRFPGPVITRFEIQPAAGVKGSQITNLSRDLARSLSVASVRVLEVVEGKPVIGLEIPNQQREMVFLREIIDSHKFRDSHAPLAIAMGKDISGEAVVFDLAKMPHLLVAGTTGSGKSVAINTMILSLLYRATHQDLRFIFIDPKMLELSIYDGIPHLLTPVVTDMKDAANALRWCVAEMERRYRLMSALGVRNLAGMNRKLEEAQAAGEPVVDPFFTAPNNDLFEGPPPSADVLEPMPHIVIIIDELADMMMVVGKKVEELIARIAQKARAAGIHLIVATQRPSVDVITGLIKANIPSRLAFQVASRVDSRTILDELGADTLLGNGDGLFRPIGASRVDRVHGAFVDDHEVHKVVGYLKQIPDKPPHIEDICADEPTGPAENGADDAESDPMYDQAVAVVLETRKASVSWVQRRLKIGYNRAARIVEQMEASGLVGPSGPGGNRDILAPGGRD
jgi:DNA segregation ATPase FtsK/SpoIIIE, S-DNA-T family